MYNYYTIKPEKEGYYLWKVPHKRKPDISITFISQFRLRGAGYQNILSPDFDYWDGYRIILPKQIEWDYYTGPIPQTYKDTVDINNLFKTITICPFCKQIPKLVYSPNHIGGTAIDSEYWYTECCSWVKSPRYNNPIELITTRESLLQTYNKGESK